MAEVTNTPWRERHCYVLPVVDTKQNSLAASTGELEKLKFRFAKSFHVSPFMTMDYEYRWNLVGPGDQLILQAENWRSESPSFDATLNLKRKEITTWSLARVFVLYPLMTAQVMANIYWQALRLWWKRIPYVPHPKPSRLDEPDTIPQTETPTHDSIQN